MDTYINYLMIGLLISFVLLVVWYLQGSHSSVHKKNKRIFFQRLIPLRLFATIGSIFKMRTLYTDPKISDINIDALTSVDTTATIPSQGTPEDIPDTLEDAKNNRFFSGYVGSIQPITFAEYVPLLREKFTNKDMAYVSQNRDFSYIGTGSDLFPSFSYAASKNMVGRTILPTKQMKCKHMVVMYGIAQGWKVQDPTSVDEYWLRASQEGVLAFGCKKQNDYVIGSYLP